MYPDGLSIMSHIIVVFIGISVGGIGGFAGIGGGPFMVAGLRLGLGLCPHLAQGTVLAVMLPPMSLLGVLSMRDRVKALWKHSIPAFSCYCAFSYIGAELAFLLPSDQMGAAFGFLLILIGLKYGIAASIAACSKSKVKKDFDLEIPVVQTSKPSENAVVSSATTTARTAFTTDQVVLSMSDSISAGRTDANPHVQDTTGDITDCSATSETETAATNVTEIDDANQPKLLDNKAYIEFSYKNISIIGSIIGVVGGFFGIGAGVLMVPIFTELCHLHKDDARTISLMILLPPVSLGAVLKYSSEDEIDWLLAGVMFILYFFSNYFGCLIGRKVNTDTFKSVLGSSLVIIGASMLFFTFVDDPWGISTNCD